MEEKPWYLDLPEPFKIPQRYCDGVMTIGSDRPLSIGERIKQYEITAESTREEFISQLTGHPLDHQDFFPENINQEDMKWFYRTKYADHRIPFNVTPGGIFSESND